MKKRKKKSGIRDDITILNLQTLATSSRICFDEFASIVIYKHKNVTQISNFVGENIIASICVIKGLITYQSQNMKNRFLVHANDSCEKKNGNYF